MRLTPDNEARGVRLDLWLARHMPEFSRVRLQTLIRNGRVTVAGSPAKPNTRLLPGQEIEVTFPEPTAVDPLAAEAIPLDILFEDSDIVVLNKPAGLVVHPACGHASGTLVNALLHHCKDLAGIGGERRPGIVHRLDRDTSGAMVVAKNEAAMNSLMRQFKGREVKKEYLAIVRGVPAPLRGRIETAIGRSAHDRKKMSTRPAGHGRNAITNYAVEKTGPAASLVRVRIETGRTHQIRVHMAHIGHPVLGDRQYGRGPHSAGVAEPVPRQMLHALRLSFAHPRTGEPLEFEAPLPADMRRLLGALPLSS